MGAEEEVFENLDEEEPDTGEEETSTPDEGGETSEDQQPGESVNDWQERVAELEAENKRMQRGLTQALTQERGKRQEMEGRLAQITDLMATAKNRRDGSDEQEAQTLPEEIEVSFRDDGTPIIPRSLMQQLTASETQALKQEIEGLKNTIAGQQQAQQQQAVQQAQANVVQQVLSSNESYPEAFQAVNNQWQWTVRAFDNFIMDNNLQKPVTADQAIEMAVDSDFAQKFSKKFPGSDLESVMGYYLLGGTRRLKRALNANVKEAEAPAKKGMSQTLKALAKNPGNLSRSPNQKTGGGGGLSLDDIAGMSTEDFEKLSDAEIEKIDRLLSSA